MSSGMRSKIAAAAKGREQTPLIAWLRKKFLLVKRTDGTNVYDHEYMNPLRHANDQVARDQPPPDIPGGPHHKITQNVYAERDARRTMLPAKNIVDSGTVAIAAESQVKPITFGPKDNFGLPTPVPGVGYSWKRHVGDELFHTKEDKVFKDFERLDGYRPR